ncbi:hypothetical protein DFQ28_005722 [Apophysomyces sp. BC1034]|nr:hypothetical protein DFQ30_003779 [Apophysomyces sp. BC1015]KAG0182625.1 hypothetical protein DFQ29_003178 [Apophysomyces sp. BC1021]KAG0193279.1 hypothetical protein DFQ28_005722 [Apophysomyces sp. BC1034]
MSGNKSQSCIASIVRQWRQKPATRDPRPTPRQLQAFVQNDPESLQAKVAMSPYAAIMASPLRLCKFSRGVFPSKLLIRFGIGWHPKSKQAWVHPTIGKSQSQGNYVKLQRRTLEVFHSKGGYRGVFRGAATFREDMTEEVQKVVFRHAFDLFRQTPYGGYPILRLKGSHWISEMDVRGFQCILLLGGPLTETLACSLDNKVEVVPTQKEYDKIPCYDARKIWSEKEADEICEQLGLVSQETVALGVPKDKATVDLAVALWRCREFQS